MKYHRNMRKTPKGLELLRLLSERGKRVFTFEEARELAPEIGISPSYVKVVLHSLCQNAWAIHLKRGVYALGPALIGGSPLHEFEVAMFLSSPDAISHWTAFQFHGLTDQMSRKVFVLTTTSASVPRIRDKENGYGSCVVNGIAYQFIQAKSEYYFGTTQTWIGEAKIQITDLERTLLDGIIRPQYCGGFEEVYHAFQIILPKLNINQIIDYALKMNIATIKRLGWLLSRLECSNKRICELAAIPSKGYRKLDPTRPAKGKCDPFWMIQENLFKPFCFSCG